MDKIQALCKEKDTTLASLERELNLGNGSIRRWDENSPSIDKVLQVSNYFEVDINHLLESTKEDEISVNNIPYEKLEIILEDYYKEMRKTAKAIYEELKNKSHNCGELKRNMFEFKRSVFYKNENIEKFKTVFLEIEKILEKEVNDLPLTNRSE